MKTLGLFLLGLGIFSTVLLSVGLPITLFYTFVIGGLVLLSGISVPLIFIFGPVIVITLGALLSIILSFLGAMLVAR